MKGKEESCPVGKRGSFISHGFRGELIRDISRRTIKPCFQVEGDNYC